jgi:hypothetical protein
VSRWLAVLSPLTMFGALSGRALSNPSPRWGEGAAHRPIGLSRWETEWAADGRDLLRIFKAL